MKPQVAIMSNNLSIIIPAKNETDTLDKLLPKLKDLYPETQINIVNDGSIDNTIEVCNRYQVNLISHPYSKGNGAAIKTSVREVKSDILIFIDADGQHKPEDISKLLTKLEYNFDMVIGARTSSTQASLLRKLGDFLYNRLTSFMTGFKIEDLPSGYRAVKREKFIKFLNLLPNGFTYPNHQCHGFFSFWIFCCLCTH